ncbi:alpha/beta fold hydrolase [Kitasatospora aureofaciens]|uniref:AB hydrolase-1 domain-containing protein n=1 Tax=Kitasatospora aureofaciens TaxID=1894 RepID=A0A1E7MV22_KITAU|nr:alpha/beta fold hydrolase [Kitasatospora aureofaciens]OEV32277.1 hypothetical protein HS99_0016305 [Kitasatospora aureofaciens]
MSTSADRPSILLVHGAWHGAWCFDGLRPLLDAAGRRTHTVDLPTASSATAGLVDDVRAVREALGRIDGPTAVVAHSYGGVPVTEALAEAPNAVHAVFLAAYPLEAGESLASFLGLPESGEAVGSVPPPEDARELFFGDAAEGAAERALARLTPQSARSFRERVTTAGWRSTRSSYIVCDDDLALAPAHQERLAARTDTVHHLPGSHSPFLSRPTELAALLDRIATTG